MTACPVRTSQARATFIRVELLRFCLHMSIHAISIGYVRVVVVTVGE